LEKILQNPDEEQMALLILRHRPGLFLETGKEDSPFYPAATNVGAVTNFEKKTDTTKTSVQIL